MTIDQQQTKPISFPKINVKKEIYFGGVPINSEYTKIKGLVSSVVILLSCECICIFVYSVDK